jgi:hypothetical protein
MADIEQEPRPGSRRLRLTLEWFLLGIVLVLCFEAVAASRTKSFSLDEFEYAHASYLVAQGLVPYRDFIEVHFPFLFQVLSPLSALGGSDPTQILTLRTAMLLPLSASLVAAWALLRHRGPWLALVAPMLLLTTEPFLRFAIEIRGDGLAFALVLTSLSLCHSPSDSPQPWWKVRCFIAGLVFGCACWTSQKVLVYGVALPLALVVERRALGAFPRLYAAGAVVVAAMASAWLSATGAWSQAWTWCFAHFQRLQAWSTVFPWTSSALEVLESSWHTWVCGVVGWVIVLRDDGATPGERLLAALLPLTFVSIAIQFAPYPYSYLPFLGVSCILSTRTIIWCIDHVEPKRGLLEGAALCAFFVAAHHSRSVFLRHVEKNQNDYQLVVLSTINNLVRPAEYIYDNTGSFVARRSILPRFFTDVYMRNGQAEELTVEVLDAFRANPPAMVVVDLRYGDLPDAIKVEISKNYLPYTGELLLPGQRLEAQPDQRFEVGATVVLDGDYVIVGARDVAVDGQPGPRRRLNKGVHVCSGVANGDVFLLRVPANGEDWRPDFTMKPRFTRLF